MIQQTADTHDISNIEMSTISVGVDFHVGMAMT